MKRIIALVLIAVLCISGCGGGVVLDENEVIEGNGTNTLTKAGVTYTNDGTTVTKDGEALYTFENMTSDRLFALGEYLYVNTQNGAMQLKLDGTKSKRFGSGEIIGAMGRWIYYQSSDNKVGSMIVYKIDMKEGRQLNLFQDTIEEVKVIDGDVFYFKGVSGNEYVNPLDEDDGYFYSEWIGETPTEQVTE